MIRRNMLTPEILITLVVHRQSRFSTFPQVLVVHAKKFQLVNWVPTKLGMSMFIYNSKFHTGANALPSDISLILPPSDILELDPYFGHGLQPGEIELPEDTAGILLFFSRLQC